MKVLCSASFSVARCSRPMWGSARWITSPSSSSTRRSTPCAAGCCGPKLRVYLRISAILRFFRVVRLAHDSRRDFARIDGDGLVDHAALLGVVAHFDMARQREVLAERMADEAVVGEDAPQVRMPLEHDAEKVERLALEPVHPGPHLDERGKHR